MMKVIILKIVKNLSEIFSPTIFPQYRALPILAKILKPIRFLMLCITMRIAKPFFRCIGTNNYLCSNPKASVLQTTKSEQIPSLAKGSLRVNISREQIHYLWAPSLSLQDLSQSKAEAALTQALRLWKWTLKLA